MTDTAQTAFWTAFLAAQKELVDPAKDQTARVRMKSGGEYEYQYCDLHGVMRQVRPILNKHGLVVTQPMRTDEGGRQEVCTQITHTSGGSIDGYTVVSCPPNATAQEVGSAISYARRYGLLSLLALAPAEEDDDGAAASKPAQRAATPAPRPAAAPKAEEPYQFVADAIGDVEAAKSLPALNRITVRASVSEWCKGAEKEEFIRARDARKAELAPAKAAS